MLNRSEASVEPNVVIPRSRRDPGVGVSGGGGGGWAWALRGASRAVLGHTWRRVSIRPQLVLGHRGRVARPHGVPGQMFVEVVVQSSRASAQPRQEQQQRDHDHARPIGAGTSYTHGYLINFE